MPIDLSARLQSPLTRNLYRVTAPILERSLAIRSFNSLYQRSQETYRKHAEYPGAYAWFDSVLHELNARFEVQEPTGFKMPTGPLMIVSNHPFGLLDAMILAAYVARHRPDVRIMTNHLLEGFDDLKPWIIAVDPFHGETSTRRNLGPMKQALSFMKAGGAMVVFPSGEVAHYKPGHGIQESPWTEHVGALARRTAATVLPVCFKGRNSVLFHTAGMVHPRLRTGLLLRELKDRSQHVIRMKVGRPILPARLRHFDSNTQLTQYLRLHSLLLGRDKKPFQLHLPGWFQPQSQSPLDQRPMPAELMRREVRNLHENNQCLVSQGNLSVYFADAEAIPHLLTEIGRCREITFRTVGEGTGKASDLDSFDDYYQHLFLWDEEKGAVAGAYRLGRCDLILKQHGAKGLYTNTLFKFKKAFTDQLGQSLELGRSFILPKYQRNITSLPLLWRGIATWVARHPQYRCLFGPVSISRDYKHLSRQLMVEFLNDQKRHHALAPLIKPRQPFHLTRHHRWWHEFVSAELRDVDDFSTLIASLEEDGKGLPVLLKHYLRLNGTLLSFNVDKAFSDCLDGLIHVDFASVDAKVLARYMGEENCQRYLAAHQQSG